MFKKVKEIENELEIFKNIVKNLRKELDELRRSEAYGYLWKIYNADRNKYYELALKDISNNKDKLKYLKFYEDSTPTLDKTGLMFCTKITRVAQYKNFTFNKEDSAKLYEFYCTILRIK